MTLALHADASQQTLVTFVTPRIYGSILDSMFDGTVRFAQVPAVVEAAVLSCLHHLREAGLHPLWIMDCWNELADAWSVDKTATIRQHVHDRGRCRMSTLPGSGRKLADGCIRARYQAIDQRGFADSRLAYEYADLVREPFHEAI